MPLSTSFSGKTAQDLRDKTCRDLPEYQAILERQTSIHAQVEAGYLKPLDATGVSAATSATITPQQRQINNNKGVDEIFKNISKGTRKNSKQI